MKKRISILLNIFISVFVPYAWLKMMLSAGGLLSSSGWGAIKYFTVQSNLFMGATSLLALVIMLTGKSVPRWAARLKYIATVAVALTFTAVVAFLGHVYGYKMMFSGANLWLHLFIPVAAIVDYAFFFDAPRLKLSDTFLAFIPEISYGALYLINLLINGRGEWPNTNDWYGFLNWGSYIGLAISAVMFLTTWGIAAGLRALNGRTSRSPGGA